LITIDTEIDKSRDWTVSKAESFTSVLKGIPDILTPLLARYDAKPTYLLSPEVIRCYDCVSTLKSLSDCELGTHLHGDFVEPEMRVRKLAGERSKEMQSSYPASLEYLKLENLTNSFKNAFLFTPKSFRAGRFGAGNRTIMFLEKLGYLVDSSVTPGLIWKNAEGIANFVHAPIFPYFPSLNNINEPGGSKVLEVPVTISSNFITRQLNIIGGRFAILNKFIGQHWLRPSFESTYNMLKLCKQLIKNVKSEAVVLNMMFHSVELIPGASPYCQTDLEVKFFLSRITSVLDFISKHGGSFCTLSELYPIFKRGL